MKPVALGLLGSLGLISFYFLIMGALSGSVSQTLDQFGQLWPWIIGLSVGFGIQVALYTKLKEKIQQKGRIGPAAVIATGTTSSVGMVACCAHHLVEVLPIIGLSALSVFLTRFQTLILAAGLFVNILGIGFMIKNLKMVSKARG